MGVDGQSRVPEDYEPKPERDKPPLFGWLTDDGDIVVVGDDEYVSEEEDRRRLLARFGVWAPRVATSTA